MSAAEFWGEPISVYTRADAIDDGALIDVTSVAEDYAPRRFASVVITDRAHAVLGCSNVEELHDVVFAALFALGDAPELDQRANIIHARHAAYVLAHAGDRGELCATIMLDGED